jgi:hypothetical protein
MRRGIGRATPERGHRLREANRGPPPVGVRQHEHAPHVHESCPAIVTASSAAHVKSVCAASPGRCCCASTTSLSGPCSARHIFTRRWSVCSCPSSKRPRILLDQHLEDRLRFERRRLLQEHLRLRPLRRERVFAGPPVRAFAISDGNAPAATYFLPAFRPIPVFIDAWPMLPCFLISSINFLTGASLACLTRPASHPVEGRRQADESCLQGGGDLIDVDGEMYLSLGAASYQSCFFGAMFIAWTAFAIDFSRVATRP